MDIHNPTPKPQNQLAVAVTNAAANPTASPGRKDFKIASNLSFE